MSNTLVNWSELDEMPGAPFSEGIVDIAVAQLRADAGWHIAPVVTETLTIASNGGSLLILPTRRIVSLSAVRDVTTGSTAVTGWTRLGGGLWLGYRGFPAGLLEVDLTHGYETMPADLLPVVADYARRVSDTRDPGLASRTVGPFTESYRDLGGATVTLSPALARYAVPGGVA